MYGIIYMLLSACLIVTSKANNNGSHLFFPDDFIFGVATSAYQTEGAWNVDGKGWSMWDYMIRTNPDFIEDKSNADITCDSYHLYKRDIEMLKKIGVKTYRFSISWPRILPYGRPDYVSPLGIAHYNAVINELIANDIVPFVTMYHWDMPQNLNEQGGWLSEEIVNWFGDYARVLYQNFGDRVKHWLTINEPYVHCFLGYSGGIHAPGIKSPGIGYYECGRHILLANARAYHIYDDEFRATQNGEVSIVLNMNWPEPATNSEDDADATLNYFAFAFQQYADPIFSEQGNYPQLFIDQVAAASVQEGYNSSRLRPFTAEQIEYIHGSADFFALNTYGIEIVYTKNKSLDSQHESPFMSNDGYYNSYPSQFLPSNDSHTLTEYALGIKNLLIYIKDRYNNPPVYITENGFSTKSTGLIDDDRVAFIRYHLRALLAAKSEGSNVRGYMVWSLMDGFEWNFGYTVKMGLYEINVTDSSKRRIARKSALIYKEIIKSGIIDYNFNPDPYKNGSQLRKMSLIVLVTGLLPSLF